ncbi:MAG: beta-propeller fold lactonase family protein [Terriglobales bacterium]
MRTSGKSWLARVGVMLLLAGLMVVSAAAQGTPHYLVTNDDMSAFVTSVSFYSIATNGALNLQATVPTGGFGIGGGYFGANRLAIINNADNQCVYASEAATGDIVGIAVNTLTVSSSTLGSTNDTGTSNGIGLATNGQYLYASYTDSSNIGTFQIQPGCSLSFVNDVTVTGLQGGIIDAMAVRGNLLVVTYGDGSIESFDISNGTPVSNGDEQNSTAAISAQGATYPSSIDITQDGHFAVFGDTSTALVVEVADISSGQLTKTVPYQTPLSINSSNVFLSPDETMLYVSDTQGDRVSAVFFNQDTGQISGGCLSNLLKGYSSHWSYIGGLTLASTSGNGGGVYAAEFGSPSTIAMVKVTSSGGRCLLQEAIHSPKVDSNSPGLLSIGTFPPRPF